MKDQAGRQGREHRRLRQPGGAKQVGDPVIANLENAERAVGERVLGVSEDGKPIIARMGRYGPMVQIGAQATGDEEKPKFAKLKNTQSIETISLEEAMDLFKLGAPLGEY